MPNSEGFLLQRFPIIISSIWKSSLEYWCELSVIYKIYLIKCKITYLNISAKKHNSKVNIFADIKNVISQMLDNIKAYQAKNAINFVDKGKLIFTMFSKPCV